MADWEQELPDIIRRFLAAHAALSSAAACHALLDSPIARKDHALTYCSRERLHSRAARLRLLAPNRVPVDAQVVT